jgi:hypothetical protein
MTTLLVFIVVGLAANVAWAAQNNRTRRALINKEEGLDALAMRDARDKCELEWWRREMAPRINHCPPPGTNVRGTVYQRLGLVRGGQA